jgi:pimeloyl-ACP methyl ester carboxylesterase
MMAGTYDKLWPTEPSDAQDGPAFLVGHSYGGVVITEAGSHDNVAGLVYIAAFAPDAGETGFRSPPQRPS